MHTKKTSIPNIPKYEMLQVSRAASRLIRFRNLQTIFWNAKPNFEIVKLLRKSIRSGIRKVLQIGKHSKYDTKQFNVFYSIPYLSSIDSLSISFSWYLALLHGFRLVALAYLLYLCHWFRPWYSSPKTPQPFLHFVKPTSIATSRGSVRTTVVQLWRPWKSMRSSWKLIAAKVATY